MCSVTSLFRPWWWIVPISLIGGAILNAQERPPTNELVLQKWSGALNVPDPVACAVDPQGRVYVAATTRRKAADLDIREHTMWIPRDVGLSSVAEKAAFFREALAPGKLRAPRGGLGDHNGDGSVDWRDLTVHTERIYQLRDADGDGVADRMTVFAEGFNTEVTGIAAGVMYHDGWLYATIAPDLWRFKDVDDDGVADIREVVAHGFGVHIAYAGHDMHGLSVGPDGRIYWSIGDKGANVTSREGRQFVYPNEGVVFRVEPDGSGFEVYARGVRNPQEPAFDDFGNLFAVDNDADMKGERERFIFIVEGSDTGWRCNYQYMKEASPWMREGLWKPAFPGQAAYLLPALANYSDGPAGFKYNPGTALGEGQRGVFLLSEFPSGKMKGFRVEPAGASFRMVDDHLLNTGIMGIGLSWHPDGSLFMADWIGGYPLDGIGAVWRIDAKAGLTAERQDTHRRLAVGFASLPDADLLAGLRHRDQRVRLGSQLELVKRGRGEALLSVARDPAAPLLARVHGIWGYGQLLRRGTAKPSALTSLLRAPESEVRAQVAKVFGDAPTAKTEARALIPLLADPEPRVRMHVAIALGKLAEPAAVEALFTMARNDGADPVLRHAAVMGLSGCARAEQLAAQTAAASTELRLICVVALRRQASPAVSAFLRDPETAVVAEAARSIHDDFSIPEALAALAALLEQAPEDEVTTRRAINANLRLGTPAGAARLLDLALRDTVDREMRVEALSVLRTWRQPSPLDRVDGWARAIKTERVNAVLEPRLDELLALRDPELKIAAIEIMMAHELQAGAERIAAIVGDTQAPGALRGQALRLLAEQHREHSLFVSVRQKALSPDAPAPLRAEALGLLLPDAPVRLAEEAARVLAKADFAPEQQRVLSLLGQAAHPAADEILSQQADRLNAGTCPPTWQLDLLGALQARRAENPVLAEKLSRYEASPLRGQHRELLEGGSVAAGREIVTNHLNANCLACHTVEANQGSAVGPSLRTIGSERSAEDLLRSLLEPAAEISPGYGLVSVTLKSGESVVGTLAVESPERVTVRLFDGTLCPLPREDIAQQSPPVSVMPTMRGILEPRELRDVVAYLRSLQARKR